MGLLFEEKVLAFYVGLSKIGHFGGGGGFVDTDRGKNCYFIVQGLHGLSEEIAEDRSSVFNSQLGIPSSNLEGELGREFHMINTDKNYGITVEFLFWYL